MDFRVFQKFYDKHQITDTSKQFNNLFNRDPLLVSNNDIKLYYMGKDIEQVILCDAILMCPGWENSKGCKVEKFTAETYGKEVLFMK